MTFAVNVGAAGPESTSATDADAKHCQWDDFIDGNARISAADVKNSAGPRVHFMKFDAHCANGPERACRDRGYLVPGDSVAIAKHYAGLACVWFNRRNVNDEIVGWLPQTALDESKPRAAPPTSSWVKEWSRYIASGNESKITITLAPDGRSLRVAGFAEWMSGGATEPHTGEFEGSAQAQGNQLTIHDNGCVVEMFLLGDDHLFVRDHFDCGGMNVTFRGLY
jgi:hypothetical protein